MEQRIKQIIEDAQEAQNKASRYEGELSGVLDKIEEICDTRDVEKAERILQKMIEQNNEDLKNIEGEISTLEALYERASRGEDISSEIERRQGTNTSRTRKIIKRTRTN